MLPVCICKVRGSPKDKSFATWSKKKSREWTLFVQRIASVCEEQRADGLYCQEPLVFLRRLWKDSNNPNPGKPEV